MARKAEISPAQLARLERDQRGLYVDDFVRIVEVLGEKPGNLLPNDLGVIGHLKPLIDQLVNLQPEFLGRVEAIVERIVLLTDDAMTSGRSQVALPEDGERSRRMQARAIARLEKALVTPAPPRRGRRGTRFAGVVSPDKGVKIFNEVPTAFRDIPRWAADGGATGVFKAAGTAMRDVGIFDGDMLYVAPDTNPPDGKLVICTIDSRLVVKIVERDATGPKRLVSKSPGWPPIEIRTDDKVKFYFVVVGIWTTM